jgi:hypothetical protein
MQVKVGTCNWFVDGHTVIWSSNWIYKIFQGFIYKTLAATDLLRNSVETFWYSIFFMYQMWRWGYNHWHVLEVYTYKEVQQDF